MNPGKRRRSDPTGDSVGDRSPIEIVIVDGPTDHAEPSEAADEERWSQAEQEHRHHDTPSRALTPGRSDAPLPHSRRRVALVVMALTILIAATVGAGLAGVFGSSDTSPAAVTIALAELDPAPAIPPVDTAESTLAPTTVVASTRVTPTQIEQVAASVSTLPSAPPPSGTETTDDPRARRTPTEATVWADLPAPRRSTTTVRTGFDGYEIRVSVTNDPTTQRYEVSIESDGLSETVIIDLADGFTYVGSDGSPWSKFPNLDPADTQQFGPGGLEGLLEALQLGPLRSDTRAAWEWVEPNGPIEAVHGGFDEWIVVVDAQAIPNWAPYALSPVGEAAPLPDPTPVGFAVYLDRDGRIHSVNGSVEYGATVQRISHTVELLTEVPEIIIPPVDALDLPEVTIPESDSEEAS